MTALTLDGFHARPVHELALGIEPVDALRDGLSNEPGVESGHGILAGELVRVELERPGAWSPARPGAPYFHSSNDNRPYPVIGRHNSGRYALVHHPNLNETVRVRIYDHRRIFVPRRLQIPLIVPDDYDEPGQFALRRRRIYLYPGAAYGVSGRATGLRGRVMRDGEPLRWARLEARIGGIPVGRAHGDDRGEFLLILWPNAAIGAELSDPITAEVRVIGATPAPSPTATSGPDTDLYWDLPLDEVPDTPDPTPETLGTNVPSGFAEVSVHTIEFYLGRIRTSAETGDLGP